MTRIGLRPHHPTTKSLNVLLEQADLHARLGQWDKAETLFRKILHTHPDHLVALNQLGAVLQNQGQLDEAACLFRQSTALNPALPEAYWNLGMILCEQGHLQESFALFRTHAELIYHANAKDIGDTPLHAQRHTEQQRAYLSQKVGQNLELPLLTRPHFAEANRIAGLAVKRNAAAEPQLAQWKEEWGKKERREIVSPAIAVIDDFLTADALLGLQRYCMESTIWRKPYMPGYIGATPEDGLGSPLLAQIADDLRVVYPEIIRDLPLRQFWAFSYDPQLRGIDVHADFAAVNINFWITPDQANLKPDGGGLILWDQPAPLEWDFKDYNIDPVRARSFLAQSGAHPIKIPYRCNRAVIFDSNLFHETDAINFQPGYANRRINLTLLYGRREESIKNL